MAAEIRLFRCRKDNYGALVHDPATGATAAIDAPEAAPIETVLTETGWNLSKILVTHHHADHTDGIAELKQRHGCCVVAPHGEAQKIKLVDDTVREGDKVAVGSLRAKVLETPGHTLGHITFWFEVDKLAFVGDTLFSIGCGKLSEGTAEMLWRSLSKLRELPSDTRVYCGHEYTLANIRFAQSIDPDNPVLAARAAEAARQVGAGMPTIPTTIAEEKAANAFLRADVPTVAAAVGLVGLPPAQVFAEVRARKNKF